MNQAQFDAREALELLRRLQVHFGKRKDTRDAPSFNLSFDGWIRKEIGTSQRSRLVLYQRRVIHEVTAGMDQWMSHGMTKSSMLTGHDV